MKPSLTRWGVVEDQNHLTHILPIILVPTFKTRAQAQRFLSHTSLDNPITDEDGTVIGTYPGHTLAITCSCGPTFRDLTLLVHHQAN